MKAAPDTADLTQASAFLAQLSVSYHSILKTARLERRAENCVACIFNVPGVGEGASSAASAPEAIHLALDQIARILTSTLPTLPSSTSDELTEKTVDKRFQSKIRQLTVGVTMPVRLKDHLSDLAAAQQSSFSDICRRLAVFGFEDFEDQSFTVNEKSLFSKLAAELHQWHHVDAQQVMLRLEPGYAVRIRSAAKEFNRSASEFSTLCVAHGLALQEQLIALEKNVAKYRGPAIRPLLPQLGLSANAAPLLAGVLVGSVQAPKALVRKLASLFEVSEQMLANLFKHSYANRPAPSFKAENGKPLVTRVPTPWEEAVRKMNLAPDDTQSLLDLEA